MNTPSKTYALILTALLASLSSAYAADAAGTVVAQTDSTGMSRSSSMARAGDFNANDRAFVFKASAGGMYEVAISKIAMDKGSSDGVKAFAKMMVDDHSKANEELKQLAMAKGLPISDGIPADKQPIIDSLSGMSGTQFDRAYQYQVGIKDHVDDIALFDGESRKGMDADLKAWAAKTLPTLKMHLQHARSMNRMR
jgi:putative membrane protein